MRTFSIWWGTALPEVLLHRVALIADYHDRVRARVIATLLRSYFKVSGRLAFCDFQGRGLHHKEPRGPETLM